MSGMTTSTSMPSLRESSSPTSSIAGSVRRFQARPAVGAHGIIDEREEDGASSGGRTNGDSLFALLNSPPTWADEEEEPAPSSPRRKQSAGEDPFHPMSVAMRAQDSQNSVQTISSTMSSESDVDAWINKSPKARQVHLKAKDERKDLAHERQINHDLADFFSNSPPPPSISTFPTSTAPSVREDDWPTPPGTANSIKKSKKTFGSLFSSRASKKSPESEDGGLGRSDSVMSKSTTASIGRRSSRNRLNSNADPAVAAAAAMRAAGFSDAAIRTASYSPPPNLAPSPVLDSKSHRRISQASVPPVPPVVQERGSSMPTNPSNKSLRSVTSHPSTGSSETEVAAHRYSSSNGHSRPLAPPISLATITSPPATLAEERLAPNSSTIADPSPHLSIAPTFQTARDGSEEGGDYSPAPTQKSKLGAVAGAGVAALAGAAGAAATVLHVKKNKDEDKKERPSADEDRSTPLPSGIAMASQELGYRSSNDTLNRDPRVRETSASTISTSAPSAPTTLDSLAPMRDASSSSAQKVNGVNLETGPDSSIALLSLKARMATASSPAECVALLEAFMAQQQRERKESQTQSEHQVEAPVAVNGDAVEDAEEELKASEEVKPLEQKEEMKRAPEHKERMESWLDQIASGGGWSAFHAPKDGDAKVEEKAEKQEDPEPLDQFERRLSVS
ncbi:hypothetical protein BCR35DRAFT_149429 [Leucosporidium creatinivorum]|uniref:Uncharacterized protein n=1 Tax=Leucosporidium creatinivorum TaxID=106004 RepID=A0A1Y2EQ79_9BASI|nr:hypothetical protein BCR35DRAFT_149429 [Leucosporidium creatinivorum]